MKLFELFEEPPLEMNNEMKHMVLDVLTPLVAQKVPFVTVQQIIDKMRNFRTGIALDRGLILNILDPRKVKAVQKVEGDRIYLNVGGAPDQANSEQEADKQQDQVHKAATDQAQKAASDQGGGTL